MGSPIATVEVLHERAHAPRKVRISTRVKAAIDLMVEQGLKRSDAAQRADLTDNALYIAMRKPEVLAYRNERLRVLRESEAVRSIARVATLADNAESEHVKLGANELLMGIEGISKVARSENLHVHQHVTPGISITFMHAATPGDDAPLIDSQPHQTESDNAFNALSALVPHPAMRNGNPAVTQVPGGGSESDRARRTPRGVK